MMEYPTLGPMKRRPRGSDVWYYFDKHDRPVNEATYNRLMVERQAELHAFFAWEASQTMPASLAADAVPPAAVPPPASAPAALPPAPPPQAARNLPHVPATLPQRPAQLPQPVRAAPQPVRTVAPAAPPQPAGVALSPALAQWAAAHQVRMDVEGALKQPGITPEMKQRLHAIDRQAAALMREASEAAAPKMNTTKKAALLSLSKTGRAVLKKAGSR